MFRWLSRCCTFCGILGCTSGTCSSLLIGHPLTRQTKYGWLPATRAYSLPNPLLLNSKQARPALRSGLFGLVAGVGFEPTTVSSSICATTGSIPCCDAGLPSADRRIDQVALHGTTRGVAAVTAGSPGPGATPCLTGRLTDRTDRRRFVSIPPSEAKGVKIPSLARSQKKLWCVEGRISPGRRGPRHQLRQP
jgi:hypothetical protein